MDSFTQRYTRLMGLALLLIVGLVIGAVVLGLGPTGGQAQQPEATPLPDEEFFRGDQPPDTGPLSAEGMETYLIGEADYILYWLRIASGEDVPCEYSCFNYTFEDLVEFSIMRCQKLGLEAWRQLPTFDPQRHEQIVGAMERACGALMSTQSTLGAPQETVEWKAVVLEAKATLLNASVPRQ